MKRSSWWLRIRIDIVQFIDDEDSQSIFYSASVSGIQVVYECSVVTVAWYTLVVVALLLVHTMGEYD